jgi:hypothetical protein
MPRKIPERNTKPESKNDSSLTLPFTSTQFHRTEVGSECPSLKFRTRNPSQNPPMAKHHIGKVTGIQNPPMGSTVAIQWPSVGLKSRAWRWDMGPPVASDMAQKISCMSMGFLPKPSVLLVIQAAP